MLDFTQKDNTQDSKDDAGESLAQQLNSIMENLKLKLMLDRLDYLQKNEVSSPGYYKSKNGYETIDIIEDFYLNFNLGNVVKYVLRAGKKDDKMKDLKKAFWYLNREIKSLEEGGDE